MDIRSPHSDPPEDGRTLASAGMDKTVLLYGGDSPLSDMPEFDEDDEEERSRWAQDLRLYKAGLTEEENETADAMKNDTQAYSSSAPHPISRAASRQDVVVGVRRPA